MSTKEWKRRKGFWKVAFFFFSLVCLFVFSMFFSSADFGPNLVVFFCVLRIRLVLNS